MTAKPDKTGPRNSSLVSGKLKSRPANPLPCGLGVSYCLLTRPHAASRLTTPFTVVAPGTTASWCQVLLVLRNVPLGDQTRILTRNKHLLRRLNNTTHVSDRAPHTHANTLRRHKIRTVITISILAPLGLPIPTLQNVAEMPINHQGILQRIPPSLLRRNISNRYFERLDLPIARSEIRGRLMRTHVRGKQRRLSIIWRPSEAVAQGVAIFSSLRPRRIHPRLKNLDETIIGQHGELKGHDPPSQGLDSLADTNNTHAAHTQDGTQPAPTATPQEPKPPQHNQGRQHPGSKPESPQARQRDQDQQDSISRQQAAAPPHHRGQPYPGSKPKDSRTRAPRPPAGTTHPPRYTPWRPSAHTHSQ